MGQMGGNRLTINSFWIRKQEMKTEVALNQERKRSKNSSNLIKIKI